MMQIAITRQVSPSINQCELTYLTRDAIDLPLAKQQHRQYEDCLEKLGCEVHTLPSEENLPDSVFVEDAAIVLGEVGIITRPGVESRRPEVVSIAGALLPFREIFYIKPPGTLDGGDVLQIGKTLYVGNSGRSNNAGIAQLAELVMPFGYNVVGVDVYGCLHLKSAVTQVAHDVLLLNRAWVNPDVFMGLDYIDVHPVEPHAANALLIDQTTVYSTTYPLTHDRLEKKGIHVVAVDVSELIKAEGAVTCCSLIFLA